MGKIPQLKEHPQSVKSNLNITGSYGVKMSRNLLASAALFTSMGFLLAGCSSLDFLGGGGDDDLDVAAAASTSTATPEVAETPSTAGETAFASGQEGIENSPTFDPSSSSNVQSTNAPTFNSDGSVGRTTITESDDGLETVNVSINGEDFTFTNTEAQSGFFKSDDGRLTVIGPDQIGVPNIGGVVSVAAFIQTENPIQNGTLPDAPEITNVGISIDGALTAVDELPAQASYSGQAVFIQPSDLSGVQNSEDARAINDFTATATFGQTNALTGSILENSDGPGEPTIEATIEATITGNTFSGNITGNDGTGFTSLDGGFFGQNAEAIAAAGVGESDGENFSVGLVGTRTDNVPVN